jgi:hypothetical protein
MYVGIFGLILIVTALNQKSGFLGIIAALGVSVLYPSDASAGMIIALFVVALILNEFKS